jgi:hypothetical protein
MCHWLDIQLHGCSVSNQSSKIVKVFGPQQGAMDQMPRVTSGPMNWPQPGDFNKSKVQHIVPLA